MQIYTYEGFSAPRHWQVDAQEMNFFYPHENGNHAAISVQLQGGKVLAECKVEFDDPTNFANTYPLVLEAVDKFVSYLVYRWGIRFWCHLETVVHPDGAKRLLVEQLRAPATTGPLTISSDELSAMASKAPEVMDVLRDFRRAHDNRFLSAVYYARTLEGLRNAIAPGVDPKKGWVAMQTALRFKKSYAEFVTKLSRGGRHGELRACSQEENVQMMERCTQLIDRYIHLKTLGVAALPETFPTLD